MAGDINQVSQAAIAADAKVKAAVGVKVSELVSLWDDVQNASKVPGRELVKAHNAIENAIGWLKAHL